MNQQTKEIFSRIWDSIKWYLLTVLVTVVIFANCKGCASDPKPTLNNHDTIYQQEQVSNEVIKQTLEELHVLKLKNDSLMARKPIYVIRYKTKFDSLYLADTSCQNSLIVLYNAFGDLNSFNDSIIANFGQIVYKDSVLIKELNTKIGLKQSRVTIDSTYIEVLKDSIPKVKRRALWKGRAQGAAAYAIIREGVGAAAKFKP